jgi:hypothetical protein
MPDPAPAAPNGTQGGAPDTAAAANTVGNVVHNAPHRGVVAAQRARAGRGETLRRLLADKLDDATPSVPAPQPGDRRPAPTAAEPESDEGEGDEPPAPRRAAAEPAEEPADPEKPAAATAPDGETTKRLTQIQQAEERSRKKLAEERKARDTELAQREAELAPRAKRADDFDALLAKAAKARSNPALLVDVFRALGFTDDHLEPAARSLYSFSKAGQADPAHRAQAERLLRDREVADDTTALRRELDDLKTQLRTRDEHAEIQRLQGEYLDHTVKAVSDDAPTVKAMAAKNPAKLRAQLWRHTEELTREQDGDLPEFAAVVARYQAELDDMGVPRPTASAPAPTETTKKNDQAADKKTPAKTLSADLSTPRVPRPTTSGREHRAETRRMLESGKFE